MSKIKISDEQKELLTKIARFLAERGFTVPTVFLLESMQPLNYVVSQILAYAEPFATVIVKRDLYNDLVEILEQRGGIDYFLRILEDQEDEISLEKKKRKAALKDIKKMKKIAQGERKSFLKKLLSLGRRRK
ncbi:MAG: hypothetical protein JXR48_07630 [Candidatus Delongbacteria bacterium]|nr:hypothetical protein [Candidatus Delongbacteria bacterium]MBN2834821.1 hypothetical protein [Candidatus Delongbacteria bacterium]